MKNKKVVFLPIKPKFAFEILKGNKTVEFRKRFPKNICFVIVYASSPEKKILCYFDVSKITQMTPNEAWSLYSQKGCIKKNDFDSYYESKDFSTVIEIEKVHKLSHPIDINKLNLKIPQSYCYLDEDIWTLIKSNCD